jgi:hypothetical protein
MTNNSASISVRLETKAALFSKGMAKLLMIRHAQRRSPDDKLSCWRHDDAKTSTVFKAGGSVRRHTNGTLTVHHKQQEISHGLGTTAQYHTSEKK